MSNTIEIFQTKWILEADIVRLGEYCKIVCSNYQSVLALEASIVLVAEVLSDLIS